MAALWRNMLGAFERSMALRSSSRTTTSVFRRLASTSAASPSVSLDSALASAFPEVNTTVTNPTPEQLAAAFKPSSHLYHSLQTPLYATVKLHTHKFLVSVGDTVTLPFRMKDVEVGDVIRLTQIESLGSRKLTWKGEPFIDDERCVVRARVVEETKEPLRVKIRKKQRTRRTKHIKSKHTFTVLTISEIGYNP
ncbi:ribosomal protein L21-like protein [Myxozyma melibiosi]|uniref:Large ribosomal subunit protein bL21m n=1 Tax=Myxozyma melibiosi TaxID=54550 RepID=A0ABR1F8F1_9ASCO